VVPVRDASDWNAMIPGTTSTVVPGRRASTASASEENVE
jgi:hypothetical protein